eukprot:GAHX01000801.1.p1 GENE.GAHX01000801.1~~GAHX01000801.1.p1  ORF type:complete len:381 (-),score=92.81 GAHX01000801.1:36-1124(-)
MKGLQEDYNKLISSYLSTLTGNDSFFGASSAMEVYYTICEGLSDLALEESVKSFPFSSLESDSSIKKLGYFFDVPEKLSTLSSCILTKPVQLKPAFLDKVNNQYGFKTIPLYDRPEDQQLAFCNDLIYKYTKQKIKDFFDSLADFKNSAFILLNIVHFKLAWLNEFETKDTVEKLFDDRIKVQMMNMTERLFYYREKEFQMFEKGLESGLSMFFVRPESDVLSLIKSINSKEGAFGAFINSFHQHKAKRHCHIEVPKFEIKTRNDLVGLYQENGVNKMFEFGGNLSRMTEEDLKVGKFLQEAYIDLNEAGIEVACVTAAIMMMRACFGKPEFEEEIVLDKPFIYGIMKEETVLFVGVCAMRK